MAKKKKKEITKADQVRAWLKKHPDGSYRDFVEKVVDIHTSQFSAIRRELKGSNPVSNPVITSNKDRVEALELRIKYLEWVRAGEREGFVDILADELKLK